jgi:hypothetical protein
MLKTSFLHRFFFFQISLLLLSHVLLAQGSQTGKDDKPFTGTLGIMFGSSAINADQLSQWMSKNTSGGMSTTGFFNYGLEGFIVKKHFVHGLAWRHEGLFTTHSAVSPKRGSLAFHLGVCPTNQYSLNQLLITVGIGYSAMTVKFHGNPPLTLHTYYVPDSQGMLIQSAFWINPKVNLLHLIKFPLDRQVRVGLDAGVSIYLPGNFKYGYNYTYYTYGYNSKGQYTRQAHTKFIGHIVNGIPAVLPVSFNISGYIGF